jgi:hypothetical protein
VAVEYFDQSPEIQAKKYAFKVSNPHRQGILCSLRAQASRPAVSLRLKPP